MSDVLNLVFKVDSEEVDKAKESVKGLQEKAADLANEIPGVGDVMKELGGAIGDVGKLLGGMEASFATAGLAAAAAAVAFGAAAIALAFHYDEVTDKLDVLGEKFNLSATQADILSKAAIGAGSSLEAVEAVYMKVATAAFKTNDAAKGTGIAFTTLGISVKDASGQLKSSQELTDEVVEAWLNGKQTTADFAATAKILGKTFEEQLPALEAVAEGNKKANEYAALGIGISEKGVAASKAQKSATQDLSLIFDVMGSQLSGLIIPYFTKLITAFTDSYKQGGLVKDVFTGLAYAGQGLVIILEALIMGGENIVETFVAVGKTLGGAVAAFVALAHGDLAGAKDILKDVGQVWVKDFGDALGRMKELLGEFSKMAPAEFAKTMDDLAKPQANKPGYTNNGGGQPAPSKEDPNKAIQELINSLTKQTEVQQHFNEVQIITNQLQEKQYQNASPILKAQAEQLAGLIDISNAQKILTDEQTKLNKSNDDYVSSIQKTINPSKESAEQLAFESAQFKLQDQYVQALTDLKNKGIDTQENETQALKEFTDAQNKNISAYQSQQAYMNDWISRGADAFIKSTGTMSDALGKLTSTAMGGFEDALTDLITKGQFSFATFAASILSDIAKMIIQFTIMIPLANQLKSALGGGGASSGGGLMSMLSSVFGGAAAEGSDTVGGNTYLVGEKGPELFTAPSNGVIIPNSGTTSSGGGASLTVHNNITVQSSHGNKMDDIAQGKTIADHVQKLVKHELVTQSRPGGMLANAQRRY